MLGISWEVGKPAGGSLMRNKVDSLMAWVGAAVEMGKRGTPELSGAQES